MRKKEREVLIELLKNCKMSDREIAQTLKTSQSTVTRNRKKLEKNIIKKYFALPEFSRLDINLASVTFGKCDRSKKDIFQCLEGLSNKCPRIVFAGDGEGMGKTCMIISLHRDFSQYTKFQGEFRSWCKGIKDAAESFLISTKDSFQTFDFSNVVKDLVKEEKNKKS